jgi:hypothetical protein
MNVSPVAAAGLVLDVAGALFIAAGLIVKRPAAIAREAGSYFGSNRYLHLSLIVQKSDAQVGAAFLVAGFAGQFLASSGWRPDVREIVAVLIACALAGLGAVVAWWLRWRRTREALAGFVLEVVEDSKKDAAMGESQLVRGLTRVASVGGVEPRQRETVGELLSRALGRKEWSVVEYEVPVEVREATAK